MCPELRDRFAGWERADSIVVNPHKWLGVPTDCSTLWTRRPDAFRDAFSLVPEYLRVAEEVASLSEYTQVLGRRFRALSCGPSCAATAGRGSRSVSGEHVASRRCSRSSCVPRRDGRSCSPGHSPSCASRRDGSDELNEQILERVNASGEVFISHTRLGGRYVLRLAIGNFRTTEEDVRLAWDVLRREAGGGGGGARVEGGRHRGRPDWPCSYDRTRAPRRHRTRGGGVLRLLRRRRRDHRRTAADPRRGHPERAATATSLMAIADHGDGRGRRLCLSRGGRCRDTPRSSGFPRPPGRSPARRGSSGSARAR